LAIPISIKDLILTQDLPTTAGSKVIERGYQSTRDALLVHRLRQAGAVIIGKANLHEFAYGVTNENAHFGPARNPWALDRSSGGSSGGSGVSVAAGLAFASIGTDTRGSIRIPSSFCGITGLKPTLGAVPTDGVIPLSTTMDHAGPMTRTVEDSALLFKVLAGRNLPVEAPARDFSDLTLGICEEYLQNVDPSISDVIHAAIKDIGELGMQVKRVNLTRSADAHWASRVIAGSEAAAYHEQYIKTQPQNYDPSVLLRLKKGFQIPAIDLVKAFQIREAVIDEFQEVFKTVDCIVGASVPSLPPRIGEDFLEIGEDKQEVVENLTRMNAPQNVAGVPALVIPCGFVEPGMPVSLQLISNFNREDVLFRIGSGFQRITDWHLRRP
jgi:aspartyl-tRNA(Asn)/glutamyl-tRNA(Gln) amidotransferase subunit A